ncbi:MAG TPA: threonine synthase [Candidatus Binatia bacterium]|jgi:threonine synthase|nr:threonine synthase [Candidatus Binatia bacterium]
MQSATRLACVLCGAAYPLDDRMSCGCGGLLDVVHDMHAAAKRGPDGWKRLFASRRAGPMSPADASGVWRYRELVVPDLDPDELVTRGEGNTRLYGPGLFRKANAFMGTDAVSFKHEGENPTGSFKDRGMTVAMSWARKRGAKTVVCASTGNTSAAVASYASLAGLPAVIIISEKGTALGKVAQSLAYGARCVMIRGDFDAALRLVMASKDKLGLTVMNSVNPIRLEGQKTIIWEALEQRGWDPPDWFVVPGGNLGNAAAFGKALREAVDLGLIARMPRLAVVQAAGADPFYKASLAGWKRGPVAAKTIATAIKIGDPVNFDKAVRAINWTNGAVTEVDDQAIMDAKAALDADGVGAEPASCATAAGIRRLVAEGVMRKDETAIAVLTGNFLKDPDATMGYHAGTLDGIASNAANRPVVIDATLDALEAALAAPR